MKKVSLLLTSLLLTLVSFAQSGTAGDLKWRISNDTLYISGKGDMPDYSTSLSAPNFSPWTGFWEQALTTVIIGEGVTRIGTDAFYNLRSGRPSYMSLKTVKLPKSLKSIGAEAFCGCQEIKEIAIPDNVTNIGDRAFDGTTWEDLQPEGLVYAGKVVYVYKGIVPEFTTITVADGTKGIADRAFSNRQLTSIIIPEGVEHIGASAFTNCSNLPAIKLPSTVKSIGKQAFYNCGINSIIIPEGITELSEKTFYGCNSLKTVTLPSSLTKIGEAAFSDCRALKAINIPDKVEVIERQTFQKCTSLESAPLPKGVTKIGESAFYQCEKLTDIELPEGLITLENSAFYGCKSLVSITIPKNITKIKNSVFGGCKDLATINLHNDITSIGEWAFNDCFSLKSIILPDNLKVISSQGFYGCKQLTAITIPTGTEFIGESAFNRCTALASVKLPYTIKMIGSGAFTHCTGLKSVDVEWENPIDVVELTFYNVEKGSVSLNIPQNTTEAYQAAEIWKEFKLVEKVELTTEPSPNEVVIAWQPIALAKNYALTVYSDEARTEVVLSLDFDANGQPIKENGNGKNGVRLASADAEQYSYTLEGLSENTPYYYTLTATNKNDEVVRNLSGEFVTTEASSLSSEVAENALTIYPNPAIDIINVSGLADNATIVINDLSGRTVITTRSTTIDVSKLSQGSYIVRSGTYSSMLLKK